MEEQRDEGEGDRGHERADEDVGHALADGRARAVGQVAEQRQQNQRREIVAGHDDTDDPLHLEDVGLVAAHLQLVGRHVEHAPREDVRQERGAPGVVYLPQQQDAEKRKADERGAFVVELQRGQRLASRFVHGYRSPIYIEGTLYIKHQFDASVNPRLQTAAFYSRIEHKHFAT